MGIPSLNSAILYYVSLNFHYTNPSLSLRMTPKSCKYNKYPGPRPRKRAFSWMGNEIRDRHIYAPCSV